MERIVAAETLDYLASNKLLNASQHGFLSKRSTLTNILESLNDWTISMENKIHTRVAYIDYSRAFDSVSHSKLLHKLKSYGFEGTLLQWITDFLSERSHCTRVGSACSSFRCIRSGVVQGSCIGPLLFLIFINDLTDIFDVSARCKLYADDVKLYTEINSVDSERHFQECLDLVYMWSSTWQLTISGKKCCVLNVGTPRILNSNINCHLGQDIIGVSNSVSDLGITVDPHLRFNEHIVKISRKAHQRANLIHRCFVSKQRDLLVRAFITYVRPLLEYNSPIWSPVLKKDITVIESVQRKFTKRIPGMSGLSYYHRLRSLSLDSLELRRLRADLLLAYRILFGLVNVNCDDFFVLRKQRQLRGHAFTLHKQRSDNAARGNFFSNRVINIWNYLP